MRPPRQDTFPDFLDFGCALVVVVAIVAVQVIDFMWVAPPAPRPASPPLERTTWTEVGR